MTLNPITVEVKVRLQALAILEAAGGYSVIVPALPECVSEGDTIEEVMANVVEAAEAWLAAGHDHNKDEDLRVARAPVGASGATHKPVTCNALLCGSASDLASVYEVTQRDEASADLARHHSSDERLQ
jgi:predicted RNase H-like HicB family nuclease